MQLPSCEADIPAEQPVHRLLRLHIRFYLFYSAKLIFRLNKESLLELLLVLIVGQTCKTRIDTSLSVQLKQIERDFLYGFLRTGDRLLPLIAADLDSFGSRSPGPIYFCSESISSGRIYKISSLA